MAGERQRHHSKSIEERQHYWQTVIRARGPTIEDTSPIIDTTDQSATTERGQTRVLTRTQKPSALKKLFQEKGLEIIVVFILAPLLLWGIYQLYSLNREVGELRSTIKSEQDKQADLKIEIEKVEGRITDRLDTLSTDIDRLERRVDDVIDNRSRHTD